MDISRLYNIAQIMIQISIAVLPIGAGATGYIAQQSRSSSILISLVLIWSGLLIIALSIFINLRVVKSKEPSTPAERKKLERTLSAGVSTFIIGAFFLVASPAGFVANHFLSPGRPEAVLSNNNITVRLPKTKPMERNVILTVTDVNKDSLMNIKTEVIVLNKKCISARKLNEIRPILDGDAWITEWNIVIQPTCPIGDHMIQYRFLSDGRLVGQANLIISIVP